MKKIITLILIAFSYFCITNEFTKTNADTNLRNYKPIKLAKGSFLRGRPNSSQTVTWTHFRVAPISCLEKRQAIEQGVLVFLFLNQRAIV